MAYSRISHMVLIWCWVLLLTGSTVRSRPPEVKVNRFRAMPTQFVRLGNTSVILYHDWMDSSIYISSDSGKNWRITPEISGWRARVTLLVAHPVVPNMAFALSGGRKHWRTEDYGATWVSFQTPTEKARLAIYYSKGANVNILDGQRCWDETYYTKQAFLDDVDLLMANTTSCVFAHSHKNFKPEAPVNLIYCIKSDSDHYNGIKPSHLLSSEDFFVTNSKIEKFGLADEDERARPVLALSIQSKYAVATVQDRWGHLHGDVKLYVTTDMKQWTLARIPQVGAMGRIYLRDKTFSLMQSVASSLTVKVQTNGIGWWYGPGAILVSSSDGSNFVESLPYINGDYAGNVDFQVMDHATGVIVANTVYNAHEPRGAPKQLRSRISFDGGRTWRYLLPPTRDLNGRHIGCVSQDQDHCTLHLHSNRSAPSYLDQTFSSPAPGFMMGVGSIGNYLMPYGECDTFLSTDAGLSWRMVRRGPHVHGFSSQASAILMIRDGVGLTDLLVYSLDMGATWETKRLEVTLRPISLISNLGTNSPTFLAFAQLSRNDSDNSGRSFSAIYIDFEDALPRKCTHHDDQQRWHLRPPSGKRCFNGIEQWFWRRKPAAICYMGEVPEIDRDPEECPCEPEDFECDFNYVSRNGRCVPPGAEEINAEQCQSGRSNERYLGSSGYRKMPSSSCNSSVGVKLDAPQMKPCWPAPAEGEVGHMKYIFPAARVFGYHRFRDSHSILAFLDDGTIWQSPNEGYTWSRLGGNRLFRTIRIHRYAPTRAYLIAVDAIIYTTDSGKHWDNLQPPTNLTVFTTPYFRFHPLYEDYIIWVGLSARCFDHKDNFCPSVAYYTADNGQNWGLVADYVRTCDWAYHGQTEYDSGRILCERYPSKHDPRAPNPYIAPLELVSGADFFKNQTKLFDRALRFTQFPDRIVVEEWADGTDAIQFHVSTDGTTFAPAVFPPGVRFDPSSWSPLRLESDTESLYVLRSSQYASTLDFGGPLFKSDANWTRFALSKNHVRLNLDGSQISFETTSGIDGASLITIVSNPQNASDTRENELQTMMTYNDGGSWRFLKPPKYNSNGQRYDCHGQECYLHLRTQAGWQQPLTTYSTATVPGVLIGVGTVGKHFTSHTNSSTFYSRDAGVTWVELHQHALHWQFGDHGSILVVAYDGTPTDEVLYSEDEGLSWQVHKFTQDKMEVKQIMTSLDFSTRKFLLIAEDKWGLSVAVSLDFSSLPRRKCVWTKDFPSTSDMELWAPTSPGSSDGCMFGRRTLYHRRRREAKCTMGAVPPLPPSVVGSCLCTAEDFECEYDHERRDGQCVPISGEDLDESPCAHGQEYWHERPAYRKIAHSVCVAGLRLDQSIRRECTPKVHPAAPKFSWAILPISLVVVGVAAAAWWYGRYLTQTHGAIYLPNDSEEVEEPASETTTS